MKYLFILGRNLALSIAEVRAFFEREENKLIKITQKKNSILVECSNKLKENSINKLGGVIAIGKVLCDIHDLDQEIIYPGAENKFNYVIWNFSGKTEKVRGYLKKRFRFEKLKTTEKRLGGIISLQNGKTAENISSGLIDEQYFVFDDYFGKIYEECNYKKIEERDMAKPVRRESLSISPRLAKIMINLSQLKKNEKLLDCFCGIGVILQEAVLQGIEVIGIDNDKNAIEGAEKNIQWGGAQKNSYKLINEDSTKVKVSDVNVIASEPHLGELLKKEPSEERAKDMEKDFENLIIKVLNNLKKNISGRIVFTSPLIKCRKKRVGCNFSRISRETGLKLIGGFPIPEYRKDQIVGRDIVVFEK